MVLAASVALVTLTMVVIDQEAWLLTANNQH